MLGGPILLLFVSSHDFDVAFLLVGHCFCSDGGQGRKNLLIASFTHSFVHSVIHSFVHSRSAWSIQKRYQYVCTPKYIHKFTFHTTSMLECGHTLEASTQAPTHTYVQTYMCTMLQKITASSGFYAKRNPISHTLALTILHFLDPNPCNHLPILRFGTNQQ